MWSLDAAGAGKWMNIDLSFLERAACCLCALVVDVSAACQFEF